MATTGESNHAVVNTLIAKALERPGWNQARLARLLGKRPQTINKWVSGENTPRPAIWQTIEDALEIERGTFLRAATGIGPKGGEEAPRRPAAASGIDIPDDLTDDERAAIEMVLEGIRARRRAR